MNLPAGAAGLPQLLRIYLSRFGGLAELLFSFEAQGKPTRYNHDGSIAIILSIAILMVSKEVVENAGTWEKNSPPFAP